MSIDSYGLIDGEMRNKVTVQLPVNLRLAKSLNLIRESPTGVNFPKFCSLKESSILPRMRGDFLFLTTNSLNCKLQDGSALPPVAPISILGQLAFGYVTGDLRRLQDTQQDGTLESRDLPIVGTQSSHHELFLDVYLFIYYNSFFFDSCKCIF